MAGLGDWARRRMGAGQPQRPQPQAAPRMPSAAPALPMPPPGYTWAVSNGQYVCIPLASPPIVAPVRQPAGTVPYIPQPITGQFPQGQAGPVAETCVIVKPGDRDPYAELLARTPEYGGIPASSGYDAMAGRQSPETIAAGASLTVDMDAPHPEAPTRAYPDGASLARGSMPLKGN